ncbi:MAG: hypothetical protein ACHQ50_12220 [Fimbriimonadales bacterium]
MENLFKRAAIPYWVALCVIWLWAGSWYLLQPGHSGSLLAIATGYGVAAAILAFELRNWDSDKWLDSMAGAKSWLTRTGWFFTLTAIELLGRVGMLILIGLLPIEPIYKALFVNVVIGGAVKEVMLRGMILAVGQSENEPHRISAYWLAKIDARQMRKLDPGGAWKHEA